MRRWVLIILLLVYPFQVALAMVDQCCVTTPAGVTHHSAGQEGEVVTAETLFLAGAGDSVPADPHCPACVFGHIVFLPSNTLVISAPRHQALAVASALPFATCPPAAPPERPKWPPAAK